MQDATALALAYGLFAAALAGYLLRLRALARRLDRERRDLDRAR